MSDITVQAAVEAIYDVLKANDPDLDRHIAALRAALAAEGVKEAVFDPRRIAQNNRQGRKLMQSYFRQRGVTVRFEEPAAAGK